MRNLRSEVDKLSKLSIIIKDSGKRGIVEGLQKTLSGRDAKLTYTETINCIYDCKKLFQQHMRFLAGGLDATGRNVFAKIGYWLCKALPIPITPLVFKKIMDKTANVLKAEEPVVTSTCKP